MAPRIESNSGIWSRSLTHQFCPLWRNWQRPPRLSLRTGFNRVLWSRPLQSLLFLSLKRPLRCLSLGRKKRHNMSWTHMFSTLSKQCVEGNPSPRRKTTKWPSTLKSHSCRSLRKPLRPQRSRRFRALKLLRVWALHLSVRWQTGGTCGSEVPHPFSWLWHWAKCRDSWRHERILSECRQAQSPDEHIHRAKAHIQVSSRREGITSYHCSKGAENGRSTERAVHWQGGRHSCGSCTTRHAAWKQEEEDSLREQRLQWWSGGRNRERVSDDPMSRPGRRVRADGRDRRARPRTRDSPTDACRVGPRLARREERADASSRTCWNSGSQRKIRRNQGGNCGQETGQHGARTNTKLLTPSTRPTFKRPLRSSPRQ